MHDLKNKILFTAFFAGLLLIVIVAAQMAAASIYRKVQNRPGPSTMRLGVVEIGAMAIVEIIALMVAGWLGACAVMPWIS
jgi:hypothetical protein